MLRTKACQHAGDVCSGDGGFPLDVPNCTSYCEDNLPGCKNIGDMATCLEAMTTCSDLEKCPTCLSD